VTGWKPVCHDRRDAYLPKWGVDPVIRSFSSLAAPEEAPVSGGLRAGSARSPKWKESSPVGQRLSDPPSYSVDMKTRTQPRVEQQLSEIDGYLELGMEEEALALIRATLSKKEISTEEFNTCVFALLQSDQPKPWRVAVETAYSRLRKPVWDNARSAMLNYYFSVGDSIKAFEFFPRRSTKFFDAWTMMQVCLELDRLNEAKKVARYCSGVLSGAEDDFTKASMSDALAAYYLRIGDWDAALQFWQQAPAEPAFQRQRLCGIVKARLLQALQAAKAGLITVAAERREPDLSTEIELPGNTATLMSDTERELKDLQHALERLIPEAELEASKEQTFATANPSFSGSDGTGQRRSRR
jgi:tetratricopeptide (TPR) repeat protein